MDASAPPPAVPPGPPAGPHPQPGDPASTPPAGGQAGSALPAGAVAANALPAGAVAASAFPAGAVAASALPAGPEQQAPSQRTPSRATPSRATGSGTNRLPAGGLSDDAWLEPCGQDTGPDHDPAWLSDPAVRAWLEESADDPPGAVVLGVGSAFALGGAADAMLPGPVLADLSGRVHSDGLARLDDDALTGVLAAASRLCSWSAALRLAAASQLAARREAGARSSGDWRPFEHTSDEIAFALTLTGRSAGRLLALAMALDRLPATRAALEAGQIDERRAEIIADELAGLDDQSAAAVEAALIGKAAGMTSGQLRPAARHAVLATNPGAAKQRKDKALKDARVEAFTEIAGTAALCGRDLPPAEVLAADKNLTALALDLRAGGVQGTLDELRAHAYLHLLTGQHPTTLPAAAGTGSARPDSARPDSAAQDSTTGQDTTAGQDNAAGKNATAGAGGHRRPGRRGCPCGRCNGHHRACWGCWGWGWAGVLRAGAARQREPDRAARDLAGVVPSTR